MKISRAYFLPIALLLFIFASLIVAYVYFGFDFVKWNEKGRVIETEQKDDGKVPDSQSELPKPNPPEEPEKEEPPVVPAKPTNPNPPSTKNWWEYPTNIKNVSKSGDDLLVLVNKEYRLPSNYAPKDLVLAETSGIRVKVKGAYYVRSILIEDLKGLVAQAKKDGVDISVISAYRSYSTQASTYQYWVNYNNGCVSCADKISARPGHSQHQLGTAIDFSSSEIGDRLGSEFDGTKASAWLLANGWRYGFVIAYPKGYESVTGYSHESWHYRYIGKANAASMRSSGEILEVWLR